MNFFVKGLIGDVLCKRLYEENNLYIEKRFPSFFVEEIKAVTGDVVDAGDLNLAKKEDCIYIFKIAEGGVFGALWEACAALGVGCEIFLEKIPIRQEIIEITELFEENPYEAESSGCLVLTDREEVVGAELIGRATADKDRVVISRGNKRFLTPPARQKKDIEKRESDGKSRKNFARE